MGTLISTIRRLRLQLAADRNRHVTTEEIAGALNMHPKRLAQLEAGRMERIAAGELVALCDYYSEALGRPVGIADLIEYRPG